MHSPWQISWHSFFAYKSLHIESIWHVGVIVVPEHCMFLFNKIDSRAIEGFD